MSYLPGPLQDFQAKVGGGQLFDMGGSTVKYGIIFVKCRSGHIKQEGGQLFASTNFCDFTLSQK